MAWPIAPAAFVLAAVAAHAAGLKDGAVGYVYLTLVVLFSLFDSFALSTAFSVFAVALLNYFFIEPRFTFEVTLASDITTVVAFVITSLAVTLLVRQMRSLSASHEEQARLLNLTRRLQQHRMSWLTPPAYRRSVK